VQPRDGALLDVVAIGAIVAVVLLAPDEPATEK
jgi:hypothetical protein